MLREKGLLPLLLLSFALIACGGGASSSADGDTTDLEEEAADPCTAVVCTPGTCFLNYLGQARCQCPGSYEALPSVGCTLDGDIDWAERDTVDTEPESEREIDSDDPIEKLPACNEWGKVFPCHLVDFPFVRTNNEGEFRVGYAKQWIADVPTVHGKWISFNQKFNDTTWPSGTYLFNYETKQAVLLADPGKISYGLQSTAIGDDRVVWSEYVDQMTIRDVTLYQMKFSEFFKVPLLVSPTYKGYLRIVDENLFFSGSTEGQPSKWDLYKIAKGSTAPDFVSPKRSSPMSYVSIDQNRVALMLSMTRLNLIDMASNSETTIVDGGPTRTTPVLTGDNLFWSDLSLSTDPAGNCGWSLFQYNLKTKEKTVLKATTGFNDYYATGAWGDWLLYQDTNEGGGDAGDPYCYMAGADSDVYLRYIPTGEEWNLSHHSGAQWAAMMDDHLVVWIDGREKTGARLLNRDIYGVDLCLHPQLKERFESCKAANRR